MPFGDGTGPAGMGPMTGRAAGYCAGYGMPGYANPGGGGGFGFGRGFGRGRGGGRGWRNRFWATGLYGWQRGYGWPAYPAAPAPYAAPGPYAAPAYPAPAMGPEQEVEALKAQAEGFRQALEDIQKRIAELSDQAKEK